MSQPSRTVYVAPEQLCVGLFVVLELNWLEHDFARNSFKIKNAEQLAQLRRLGLKRVQVDPARSDARPLPMPDEATPVVRPAEAAPDSAAMIAKRERMARIQHQQAAVAQCEAAFLQAATALKDINTNLFARPEAALASAEALVRQMLDSILTDKDIAIHLMNEKSAGEEMYFHSLNVAVLAMMLGRELGLGARELHQLGIGCLLHDIGKLDIPDRVRLKTEPHTRAERNLVEMHPQYGLAMAQKLGLPRAVTDIILQHHEHVDGSGYPHRLTSNQISPLARIVAIVNTYDELCNQPNMLDSMSPFEALSFMFAHRRQNFDIAQLNTFIRCMGVYPPGTIVRLSDDTLGLVVSVNSANPIRPAILIHDASVPKAEAIIIDLMTEPELTVAASLKPAQLTREVHEYLSPRRRTTYYFDSPHKNTPGKR